MRTLPFALLVVLLVALVAPFALARQEPAEPAEPAQSAAVGTRWEYKVIGLTEIYGSTLEYLKGAIDKSKGVLGVAKATVDLPAAKTQDLLNEYGVEGWELEYYSNHVLILKRPLE